eukprot:TRINITY_DN8214_c0_g1_i1.p1 TRINITY_DN8214_c0_g1~~TRINITY_DN8214_c0_g1_i1.p1  ORF type:complete len:68 (+),score=9.68 TRINITY_DN8214_c0_g1_i1:123-326(+)
MVLSYMSEFLVDSVIHLSTFLRMMGLLSRSQTELVGCLCKMNVLYLPQTGDSFLWMVVNLDLLATGG